MNTQNNDIRDLNKEVFKIKQGAFIRNLITGIIVVVALFIVFLVYVRSSDNIYGIDETGNMFLLTRKSLDETTKTRIAAGAIYFIDNFYSINPYNHEDKVQKALGLADESGEQLFLSYKNQKHYEQMEQFKIIQNAKPVLEEIEIKGAQEPYSFSIPFYLETINRNVKETYKVIFEGTAIGVSINLEKNPPGILLQNLNEKQIKRIKRENI